MFFSFRKSPPTDDIWGLDLPEQVPPKRRVITAVEERVSSPAKLLSPSPSKKIDLRAIINKGSVAPLAEPVRRVVEEPTSESIPKVTGQRKIKLNRKQTGLQTTTTRTVVPDGSGASQGSGKF